MYYVSNCRRLFGWLLALAVASAVVSIGPSTALAQEDGGEEEVDVAAEYSEANRLASAGAITRSIPHYKKVLRAAPNQFPRAYYNLAEVFRAKDECSEAVLLYRAYRTQQPDGEKATAATGGINRCSATQGFGALAVEVSPEEIETAGAVVIDGYRVGRVEQIEDFELLPGEYTVEVAADTYEGDAQEVAIEEGETARAEFELEKKLYFGEVLIEVDQEGADISIEPRELDSPKAEEETFAVDSPMEDAEELPTGEYFLEVNKSGFDRWIRNIEVRRDDQTTVDVRMSESLPEAIRRK